METGPEPPRRGKVNWWKTLATVLIVGIIAGVITLLILIVQAAKRHVANVPKSGRFIRPPDMDEAKFQKIMREVQEDSRNRYEPPPAPKK